jgi:hypothetical protein
VARRFCAAWAHTQTSERFGGLAPQQRDAVDARRTRDDDRADRVAIDRGQRDRIGRELEAGMRGRRPQNGTVSCAVNVGAGAELLAGELDVEGEAELAGATKSAVLCRSDGGSGNLQQ